MVRGYGSYDSYDDRTDYRRIALDDQSVSQVLKDLHERIIPEKNLAAFRRLVEEGGISPAMAYGEQPLMSPVSQVLAMDAESAAEWLKALFSKEPHLAGTAKAPGWGLRWGNFSSDIRRYDGDGIETPLLMTVLAARGDNGILETAALYPAALANEVPARDGGAGEPLFHQLLASGAFSIRALDRLEELCGGADFLTIKNARGETLLHRIAADPAWGESQDKLDAASWMLQKNPQLANAPDRFGWTPLDRLLSRAQGKLDSSMGRLLLASGARLEKQIAPHFNLAAVLQAQEEKRLEKPPVRRLLSPGHPA